MTLQLHLELVQADLPRPFGNAKSQWTQRQALKIRIQDGEGRVGVGEACPLPDYSPDTLAEVQRWLVDLQLGTIESELDHSSERSGPPSAKFGLETALLDLLSRVDGTSFSEAVGAYLGRPLRSSLRLSGMISTLDPNAARDAAQAQVDEGIVHIKVKVGRAGGFEQECRVLTAVKACLPPQGSLRVDANQAFGADILASRLAQLVELGVSLVEEPGPLQTSVQSPLPIALDETLQTPAGRRTALRLVGAGHVSTLVVKPAVLGGLRSSLAVADAAHQAGAAVSLSHLMDGLICHRAYVAAALCIGDQGAQGLAPHVGLSAFGGLQSWPVRQGGFYLEDEPRTQR